MEKRIELSSQGGISMSRAMIIALLAFLVISSKTVSAHVYGENKVCGLHQAATNICDQWKRRSELSKSSNKVYAEMTSPCGRLPDGAQCSLCDLNLKTCRGICLGHICHPQNGFIEQLLNSQSQP